MLKTTFAAFAVLLLVSGCASTGSKPVDVRTVTVQKPKLNLPAPDQVLLDPIKWYALAKKAPPGQRGSIEHFWQEMEKKGYTTGMAISPEEFKKIARNEDKKAKLIRQQQAIIKAYRKYYEENK